MTDTAANQAPADQQLRDAAYKMYMALKAVLHWYNEDSTTMARDNAIYAAEQAVAEAERTPGA